MQTIDHSGHDVRYSPHGVSLAAARAQPSAAASAAKSPPPPTLRQVIASEKGHRPALLTAAQAATEVYGVSERTFHAMRSKGLVPAPIVLGPRLLRWARADLEAAIAALPRKEAGAPEPAQLLRGKIERLKAGAGAEA